MWTQVILATFLFKFSQPLQCVDHNNNPVDWYVVYKLPSEHHSNPLLSLGAAYTYITSNDYSNGWKLSNISVNDTNSLVGVTLNPLFNKNQTNLHILYNDELPDGSVNFKKGHTKGLILSDYNAGLWLIHSVPRFPPVDAGYYYYPHNGYIYGQSFLCISLNLNNLDKIGTQLQYNTPNIFDHNIPDILLAKLPNLSNAVKNVVVQTAPWYHLTMLNSLSGIRFLSFAKTSKFAKELYADWVAPTLNSNLSVETWPNGGGRLPSSCGLRYSVYNIKTVTMPVANVDFKSTNDHSKWAVSSTNSTSKWICIGDINRAAPQRHRAGGTVCFSMNEIATAYQQTIEEFENCNQQN